MLRVLRKPTDYNRVASEAEEGIPGDAIATMAAEQGIRASRLWGVDCHVENCKRSASWVNESPTPEH
eukprot:6004750-Alexandrium_andersonii.AAC.1